MQSEVLYPCAIGTEFLPSENDSMFSKMGRTFGKYRSRRSKEATKKAAAKKPEPEEEKIDDQEVTDTESEVSEENPKGGALFDDIAETGQDYLKQMHRDTQVAMDGLLPNRLHVETMDSDLLPKVVSVLDDHQYDGLKHAAKYILGHPTDTVFHHRHRASQPMKHFQKIAESTRDELASHLAGSDTMHRAVHEAMHSAHLGGGFDFSHAIHVAEHLHEPLGGGITDLVSGAGVLQKLNPLENLQSAKSSLDEINLNDTSVEGISKNVLRGYSANFNVAAAHMKTSGAIATATGVGAPEGLILGAAGTGMGMIGDGLNYVSHQY